MFVLELPRCCHDSRLPSQRSGRRPQTNSRQARTPVNLRGRITCEAKLSIHLKISTIHHADSQSVVFGGSKNLVFKIFKGVFVVSAEFQAHRICFATDLVPSNFPTVTVLPASSYGRALTKSLHLLMRDLSSFKSQPVSMPVESSFERVNADAFQELSLTEVSTTPPWPPGKPPALALNQLQCVLGHYFSNRSMQR